MTVSTQFNGAKDDLQHSALIEAPLPARDALPEEALLVKIERFAFTANNITYAMLGDAMKYWQLFRAPQGFGNIPVWGFGKVIASRHPQIEPGTGGRRTAVSRHAGRQGFAAPRPHAFARGPLNRPGRIAPPPACPATPSGRSAAGYPPNALHNAVTLPVV